MFSRRTFLKLFVAMPFAVAAMPVFARMAPKTFRVLPPPIDPLCDIWWFAAKRPCVIEIPGSPLFVLEQDEACCFVAKDGQWVRHTT